MDVQAISPSPFHFMYWLPADVAVKMSRAVNEHLAGIVKAHPDRFVALGHVPLQAPDAAAAELEYCVKQLGFRGCEIGTNVVGGEVSRGRDQFWKMAQDLDVVVFMHPNGFTQGDRLTDHYFTNVIGNPLDTTVALGHIVFDGLLERFPKLKIVAAHGGGYIAHYPARMDHVWGARVDARTVLKKTPAPVAAPSLLRHDRVRAGATAAPGQSMGRRSRAGRHRLSLRHGDVRSRAASWTARRS